MNLIDTYTTEVGRHLPLKNRSDIEAEIRSTLQDMLDERSQNTGKVVDDEMTFDVLKEYGSPEKVASSYMPERYLIGPRLFPIFFTIAKIVLWVTGLVALIGLGLNLGEAALNIQGSLGLVWHAVVNFYGSALTSLASLVFIFAIIEWAAYQSGKNLDLKSFPNLREWDPHSLVKIVPSNRVKQGETITDLVFTFLAILLFNFYPQAFSFSFSATGNWYIGTGTWSPTPILSQAFFHFVPILTIVWVLTIILDIILLSRGYWNTLTRLLVIGIKVCSIGIGIAMLNGPSLLALTNASFPTSMDPATVNTLLDILQQVVLVALWISVIGGIIDVIRRGVGLIKSSSSWLVEVN
jgi:hypothetical protein